jgi:predicted metal-dependent HD superfamily phosphohydrolase
MNLGLDNWRRLWGELGAKNISGGLLNQLVAAYSEPHRHYHTLQHLRECLDLLGGAREFAERPGEVELALWFHDAVYDVLAHDNEARSADWARDVLLKAGAATATADRIHALIVATAHHAAVEDVDTQLLLDVDLAILGAAPVRFDEYETQIRDEYAHVPEAAFRSGRARILRGFLERPNLYGTGHFRALCEETARANLRRALRRLD